MNGKNVFIEFKIIKESAPDLLYKELDVLLATGKRIFVWSKTVPPQLMRAHCAQTGVKLPQEELDKHSKVYEMRRELATYQEISEVTGIPVRQLGWYIATTPNRQWTLDDWIADYYIKDSAVYQKVDAIIDCEDKVVEKFKRRGIPGNTLEPLSEKNY
jgi:hypothetical protein